MRAVCVRCGGDGGRPPQRTIKQNLNTWQGRRAAIVAAHPEWATEPIPKGVPHKRVHLGGGWGSL